MFVFVRGKSPAGSENVVKVCKNFVFVRRKTIDKTYKRFFNISSSSLCLYERVMCIRK